MQPPEIERKPSVLPCPRCDLVNAMENKYCSKCAYPLIPSAFEELKLADEMKIRTLENKHETDMISMREDMDQKLNRIMSMIQQNPKLLNIKPDSLKKKI